MAACGGMQSMILGSPISNPLKRNGVNQFVTSYYFPRFQWNSSLCVKCMSEDGEKDQSSSSSFNETAATPTPTPTPPPAAPKSSSNLGDIFAFSGPAPERINGRLAMIGFVAAIGVELANGGDIFAQLSSGGFSWFLGTSALLTLASLIPLFQGVTAEKKSGAIMTADAELWNGRFAMLGLVALAFTEYVKGSALI